MRKPRQDVRTVPVNDKRTKLMKSVDAVLQTEEGRDLFIHLFNECGYNRSSLRLSRTTGELLPISTEAAEARRLLYIELRALASRDLLAVAERLAEEPPPAAEKTEEGKPNA
jgi:hypothetical protein